MDYNDKVIDHFKAPHNMGQLVNPDGVGQVGNPVCGDLMKIYLKVGRNDKNEEIIEDIKFETLGCVAAIATSSMVTELVKGKTLNDALLVKFSDVEAALGSLPPVKKHCADLAVRALLAAIENFRSKSK